MLQLLQSMQDEKKLVTVKRHSSGRMPAQTISQHVKIENALLSDLQESVKKSEHV